MIYVVYSLNKIRVFNPEFRKKGFYSLPFMHLRYGIWFIITLFLVNWNRKWIDDKLKENLVKLAYIWPKWGKRRWNIKYYIRSDIMFVMSFINISPLSFFSERKPQFITFLSFIWTNICWDIHNSIISFNLKFTAYILSRLIIHLNAHVRLFSFIYTSKMR